MLFTEPKHESVGQILEDILDRNGCDRPDGRPLYSYRVSDGEILRIGHSLSSILKSSGLRHGEESAAFCLYFGERFRKAHTSGSWKWETVLPEICSRRTGADFHDAVDSGLRWWKRNLVVVGAHRRFLVTLACEGGLPLALLQREGSHLRRFFHKLLAEHEAYPTLELEESASKLGYLLPKTLAHGHLFVFAARMVRTVAELRRKAEGFEDPVMRLDSVDPKWRHRIPLRLEDDVARELLEGLLSEPRGRSEPGDVLAVSMELSLVDGASITRVPNFPPTMAAKVLEQTLGVGVELPPRVRLALRGPEGDVFPFCRVTRVHDGERLHLESLMGSKRVEGTAVGQRLDLVVFAQGKEIASASIAGGESEPDLPWVFTDREDAEEQSLLGVGAVRSKAESLLVVVHAQSEYSGGEVDCVGELPELERVVHRVRGEVRYALAGEQVVVRTGQEKDEERRYRLSGRFTTVGIRGTVVWVGLPHLLEEFEENPTRPVPENELQCRLEGGDWSPLSSSFVGAGEMRHVCEGETRFKTRIVVLPRSFESSWKVGGKSGSGELHFRGVPGATVVVAPRDGLFVECRPTSTGTDVLFESSGSSSLGRVDLVLQLEDRSRVEMSTRLPVQRVGFTGRGGRRIEDGSTVGLGELSDIQAVVVTPRSRDRYYLEILGPHVKRQRLCDLHQVREGHHVLALHDVQRRLEQLLASDWSLDAELELRIVPVGMESPGGEGRIRAKRFKRRLIVHTDEETYGATLEIQPAAEGDVVLALRPMNEPNADPRAPWPIANENQWYVSFADLAPGPWLVTTTVGGHVAARPQCVLVPGKVMSQQVNEELRLSEAAMLGPEEFDEALRVVAAALAQDANHADWRLCLDYLATLKALPARTYRIVTAIASDPDAAALATLKSFTRDWLQALWERFETIPFMWHLLPIQSWILAGRRVLASFEQLYGELPADLGMDPREPLRRILGSMREQALRRMPALEIVADALGFVVLGDAPTSKLLTRVATRGSNSLDEDLDQARNAMRIRNHEVDQQDWPSGRLGGYLDVADVDREFVPWKKLSARWTNDVVNAPIVAATIQVYGSGRPLSDEVIAEFKSLRTFDAEWFDHAHALTVARLLPKRLEEGFAE